MGNTKTKKTDQSKLAHNTVRWLNITDIHEAAKYLVLHEIPFQVKKSGEGFWVNVSWKNGITAPLTYQELDQLPDYLAHRRRSLKGTT